MSSKSVQALLIVAANHFTAATVFQFPKINVSVWGTLVASTVSLQRSFDGGSTWLTLATYTTPTEAVIDNVEPQTTLWRVGVASGNYSGSDSINCRMGQETGSLLG